jgi:lipopolysaccharide assembly protein A
MLKKIGIVILVIAIFGLMIWFTFINPGNVEIDLAFTTVTPSIPVAFSVMFIIGWAFGLLCTSIFILRLVNERRQLRRSLRHSESEVSSLRNLPLNDAD